MPDLAVYLERIGFRGTPRADLETLRDVHRRHLLAIPYENLDVQLGVRVGTDIEGIYRKLVLNRRGGWCYEMNGLLAWALETIGFSLTRLAAGVMREARGDAAVGNHMALWVHGAARGGSFEEPYLADVGFGDGVLEPFALREGPFRQRGFDFALERLDEQWWRFHNHQHSAARSFDFNRLPADLTLLRRQCEFLQTAPESPFTQVAVVQRHLSDGLALLRGRVLSRVSESGVEKREIADEADYFGVLHEIFDLDLPRSRTLWEKVQRQHSVYV